MTVLQFVSFMSGTVEANKAQIIALLEEAYTCRVNDLRRSTELADEALALSRQLNDRSLVAKSLSLLALFAMIHGDQKGCMAMSEEAIKYFEELNDEKGIADAKYNMAGIYYKTDNYHLGLVYLIDCLTTYRKFDDHHNQARVLKSLGTIYEYFGDQKNAVKSYEEAIAAAQKANDTNLESNAYNPLSGIYLDQGRVTCALDLIERSISMKKNTGDIRGLAFALYGRGKVFAKLQKYAEAEADFQEAISIHKAMGERLGRGMVYYKMGALYMDMENVEKAKELLQVALDFSEEHNIAIIKFKSYYLLYKLYKREQDHVRALEYLERYLIEKETVINTQTLQIIENYELITRMEKMEKDVQVQREKAEIIEKKNIAEQSARVKQEFLSTMSHEIRTPLNAVTTIATLLSDKIRDPEEKQLIDSLIFAANNLLLIINDILDFTKLDAGKAILEIRPVNFTSLINNIRDTYKSLAKEKGINLYLSIDANVADSYELDETKVSQILGNLITNAIKFTEQGRVELSVEQLSSEYDIDLLRFKVTDTGIGIPENHLVEIFESFSQPKSITTRKHGGSGLGLAIVKKLVELHNSDVRVNSVVNEGSVFYFDLYLKKSATPTKVQAKVPGQLKNKIVLLAEDNMINAMVAIKLLSKWDVTTVHAKNGVEAIAKTKQKVFDFILMDIHMPEMDGFEATRHIRQHDDLNTNTPIFALTADVTAEQQEEYTHYFNGFLRKPIEIDKLYDALQLFVE